jgi:hypothetical protein
MAALVNKDNYWEMLEVYKKHSRMHGLIRHMEKKMLIDKLDHEMKKLYPQAKPAPKPKPEPPKPAEAKPAAQPQAEPRQKLKVIRNFREVYYDDLPKKLQVLWDRNRDEYKEIRALHEKLKLMENGTPKDREPLTMRITMLDLQIHERWKEIDAWSPVPDELKIDHKRISSNRKYISTWLDRLDKGCEDRELAVANLQDRYNEMWLNHIDISEKTLQELHKYGVKVHGITTADSVS